jgi:hypothetical protein
VLNLGLEVVDTVVVIGVHQHLDLVAGTGLEFEERGSFPLKGLDNPWTPGSTTTVIGVIGVVTVQILAQVVGDLFSGGHSRLVGRETVDDAGSLSRRDVFPAPPDNPVVAASRRAAGVEQ